MASESIAVIDYGMGNLHSVAKAIEHVAPDAHVQITANQQDIINADRVIFPGVGAIQECMAGIRRQGLDVLLPTLVQEKPVLAICVGMQALMNQSEENNGVDCLSILPGNVRFFGDSLQSSTQQKLKVPHMGWNEVHQTGAHSMWHEIDQDTRFYFVHSFFVQTDTPERVVGATDYGLTIVSAMAAQNLFAVQFHPEKSHDAGLQLLRNFVHWSGVE